MSDRFGQYEAIDFEWATTVGGEPRVVRGIPAGSPSTNTGAIYWSDEDIEADDPDATAFAVFDWSRFTPEQQAVATRNAVRAWGPDDAR